MTLGEPHHRAERGWTLLTSHGRILLMIARDPAIRIRDIATGADVTERTAQGIVADLRQAGYITQEKVGRRNVYTVSLNLPFRHSAESGHTVGELVALFHGEA